MLNKKICREFAAPGAVMSLDSGLLHAEQVKYIVQAEVKIISHKRTLVLYIHDRERAAQGDLRPLWTMFHSKDGYYYSYPEARWKPGPRPVYSLWCYNYEADISGHVYCKNLPEVLDNTPWKYCPLAAFYQHFRKPMAVIPFLAAYLKQPRLEHLVKVGFFSLVRDMAYNSYDRDIPLDQTQDRTHRILEVQAEDVDFLRGLDVDFEMLRTYQEYCWENLKDRQRLFSWQLEHGVRQDVLETLDYMTVHKMLRYLDAQYEILKDRRTPFDTPRYRSMQDVLSEYRDYLDMCAGQDYDMRSSFVLYPRDLQASHDRVAQHIKVKNDGDTMRAFKTAYAHVGSSLDYEYKGMAIVRPGTPDEIVEEGNALHHCVGSYISRVLLSPRG